MKEFDSYQNLNLFEKQKEKISPIDAREYVRRSLITTKLINLESEKATDGFKIVESKNPIFQKAGEEIVLEGNHKFAQIENLADCEKISIRIDALDNFEIESLSSQINQNKIEISKFATILKNQIDPKNLTLEKSELLRQLEYVCSARDSVHFGKEAKLPDYRLSENGELVVFDGQVNAYVRLAETSNDLKTYAMLTNIEAKLVISAGPIRISYIGALSERTKNKQTQGANPIVISTFVKNETGEISFSSDLPPDGVSLADKLNQLGVEPHKIEAILQGQCTDQVVKIDKNQQQQSGYKFKTEAIWQAPPAAIFSGPAFVGGSLASLNNNREKYRNFGFRMGAGGLTPIYPVFKPVPIGDLNTDDEEEEEELAYGVWRMAYRRMEEKIKKENKTEIEKEMKIVDLLLYKKSKEINKNQKQSAATIYENLDQNKTPIDFVTAKNRLIGKRIAAKTKRSTVTIVNLHSKSKIISIERFRKAKATVKQTSIQPVQLDITTQERVEQIRLPTLQAA